MIPRQDYTTNKHRQSEDDQDQYIYMYQTKAQNFI